MTRWMRDELMASAHHKAVFATLAARSIEAKTPPTPLPPPCDGFSVVSTAKFGISVRVPEGALGEGGGATDTPKLALRSMAPQRVYYLHESEQRKRGEFAFSPVVQIDYPAAAEARDDPSATVFASPLTLEMPHCFCPRDGLESCVMLGARHGATSWEAINAMNFADHTNPIEMSEALGVRPSRLTRHASTSRVHTRAACTCDRHGARPQPAVCILCTSTHPRPWLLLQLVMPPSPS